MKKINILIATSIIGALINIHIASAQFTDLDETHKNYDAIIYLYENNILNGYEDSTFKPDKEVNRVEFLKIVIEGSEIDLDKDESTILPFSDIYLSEWYIPYLRKAYAEGWIVGYSDNTFRPDQSINKAEALKILGEIQSWEINENEIEAPFKDTPQLAWYTKYITFAKDNNFLEETNEYFYPDHLMTRAEISEIIYRTLINSSQENAYNNEENIIEIEEEEEPLTFTPVEYNPIATNFFEKIDLTEKIPNTFYKNEIYTIKGDITSEIADTATIFIQNDNDDTSISFRGDVENNHFEIPIHLRKSGNYTLGIIPGESGNSKIAKISVLPSLPSPSNPDNYSSSATSLNIDFDNDKTFVNFNTEENTINRLTFIQEGKKTTYISRQEIDSIEINYSDFENFNEGDVSYYIETAKTKYSSPLEISSSFNKSSVEKFNALEHSFAEISDKILANPPSLFTTINDISFIGTVYAEAQISAYVIKPDGFVDNVSLSSSASTKDYYGSEVIDEGGDFEFKYSPSEKGRYIIEILDKNGMPLINHPVYIGGGIPLIPDYFDLNERKFFTQEFNLEDLRKELIDLINKSRTEHGLNKIITTDDLNDLAQSHSEDMATDNFFGHINSENQTPEERRVLAGIKTTVSENLAQDVSIAFGHLGLMRSASHRKNILRDDWERVGLGIALKDGYLFITEEFSTLEIEQADLENYKTELLTEINEKRASNGTSLLAYNDNLESASQYLNNKTIQEDRELATSDLENALEQYNISGTAQYIGRTYTIWSEILYSIIEEESSIIENIWGKIGIDIQLDDTGSIHASFLLNN